MGGRRGALHAHRRHDFQQVIRVGAGTRAAAREHEIIAGALALGSQMLRGRPYQRMEPIECAHDASQRVTQQITATDVRQLVEEHHATALVAPLLGARRQHDSWTQDAAREWHLDRRAHDEPRRMVEIQPVGDVVHRAEPRLVAQRARTRDDATHGDRAEK